LVKEDGLKQKDVAELLHLSLKTVENQLAIAVKRIALAIGKTRITKQGKPENTEKTIHPPLNPKNN
jgi:DNA-directed RNA polymerase specialized sigma24 family protein